MKPKESFVVSSLDPIYFAAKPINGPATDNFAY